MVYRGQTQSLMMAGTLACLLLSRGPAQAQFGITFHYDDYSRVLAEFVDEAGLVDYAGLQANREPLDFFVRDVSGLYTELYASWDEEEKLAFWINAYNGLTLRAVVDHYPIRRKLLKFLAKPAGVRDIPGIRDELPFSVMAESTTLDRIEQEHLRAASDPRMLFALARGAKGSPPLRREPYRVGELSAQLDDQCRRFLARPDALRLDHEAKVVHLSSLFDQHADDFVKAAGAKESVTWGDPKTQAILAFIGRYLPAEDWEKLKATEYAVEFMAFDWGLNSSRQ